MRENDQPFSSQWERYSLIDLKGNEGFEVTDFIDWDTVVERLKPLCPKCNRALTSENILKKTGSS